MNCGTCKYWKIEGFRLNGTGNCSSDDTKNENAGTCRHDSPASRINNWRAWPVTIATDYCWKYESAIAILPSLPPPISPEAGAIIPHPNTPTPEPVLELPKPKKKFFDKKKN